MSFYYTKYFYPIEERVTLSRQLNFYLDNPRSKQEIQEASQYLQHFCNSDSYFRMIAKSKKEIDAIEWYLLRFRNAFVGRDKYLRQQFIEYKREKIIDFIARMIIIARYDDDGAKQMLKRERRKITKGKSEGVVILLDDDHPAIVNQERLENYAYLLSLLAYTDIENYWGHCFLLGNECSGAMDDDPWFNFMILGGIAPRYSDGKLHATDRSWDWYFYPAIKDRLDHVAQALEDTFAQGETDKLLYVGNILRIVGRESRDVRVKVLLLVSILELLLTHNPDFNRFNVEDSINKQFQLKTSILLHKSDPRIDLNKVRSNLKTIYQVRSSIAHGSVLDHSKIARKQKAQSDPIEEHAQDLYKYVRVVLEEYLKNRNLVEFLKSS